MKTAIYIQDGLVQLVLTPENKFEREALGSFTDKPVSCEIKQGSFYECRGGYTRESTSDHSLIIVNKVNP